MTKSIRIYQLLREAWALGKTQEEFGGDKEQDFTRLQELTDEILKIKGE